MKTYIFYLAFGKILVYCPFEVNFGFGKYLDIFSKIFIVIQQTALKIIFLGWS